MSTQKKKPPRMLQHPERPGGGNTHANAISPPLFYHTERGSAMIEISSFLKHGRENATSSAVLCGMLNTTPRGLRHCIAIERAAGAEILYTPGGRGGYFLPSLNEDQAQKERAAFYKTMRARAMCTLNALRPVARSLKIPAGQMKVELFSDGAQEEG